MKLKYYLRGMGIGIILTAIVMGFALGGRKATLSNAQIIERAKALGMVEQTEGVLTDTQNSDQEAKANDSSSSNKTLDSIREEIPQEDNKELASAGSSVSEVDEKKEESPAESGKAAEAVSEASDNSKQEPAASEAPSDKQDSKKTDDKVDAGSPKDSESTVEATSEATTESRAQEIVDTVETPAPALETAAAPVSGKTVTIPGGLGSEAVAALLVREGLVDNAVSFNQYLVTTGKDRTIRSGTKVIPEGASYEEVANIITRG